MMRFGSGVYNVRDSESIREFGRQFQRTLVCTVHFLDGSREDFEIDRHSRGQNLLDRVFEHLELVEKDFFGLQFIEVSAEESDSNLRWMEANKSIRRQMQCPPYLLYFRVKFYVSDPSKLLEEYTRYHFYLQIRKDLIEGRLICPESSAALLGSYAAQSEFGDHFPQEHNESYLNGYQFVPDQTASLLRKIQELHKLHRGQTPADAEFNFLDHAKRLDMYGMDLYSAKDAQFSSIQLGVSSNGVVVFQNAIKMNTFSWSKIMKLSFKRKQFYLQMRGYDDTDADKLVVFNLSGTQSCKLLWKSCIEHHTFFRLIAPPTKPEKSLFSLGGSRYRYSGRTEYQSLEEMKRRARIERTFHRTGSKMSFGPSIRSDGRRLSSVVDTLPITSESNTPTLANGHNDIRRHSRDIPSVRLPPSRADLSLSPMLRPYQNGSVISSLNGDISIISRLSRSWSAAARHTNIRDASKQTNGGNSKVSRETTFGVTAEEESISSESIQTNGHLPYDTNKIANNNNNGSMIVNQNNSQLKRSPATNFNPRSILPNGHRRTNGHLFYSGVTSPMANGIKPPSQRSSIASRFSLNSQQARNGFRTVESTSPPESSLKQQKNRGSPTSIDESLVVIRMRPDSQGRFGFNVKGGADQNYPVIVSRVALDSAADQCYPKLNEGDQVLMINGRDVAQLSHEHVVRMIRAAREATAGELVLTVRPNAYAGEEIDEPDFQYVPDTPHVSDSVPRSDLLNQSLLMLRDALKSGATVMQFEQLYRKKPGLSLEDCRLSENMHKNRYRDVLPYDSTRVILKGSPTGDYINASFVNMEIPSSGIVNRYIAAQGPLPHTSADFWRMIWEQLCSTVVMLTTTVERGRVKCHQYWPKLFESKDFNQLQVTCLQEKEGICTSYREFAISDKQTNEERHVSQMQYVAWPDHGVPDDPRHFIDFMDEVRKARIGSVEPLLVHCSAGIGRTGVLILMETAAGLIEANEPVYPLDIVRTMRDQRPQLIQNSSQYRFVCEAVMKAYNDNCVQPLAEYHNPR